MKLSENLQKLLPFGYLFLVVIGILKESVFFYQIGINILKYSSIMDILISPIATLTSNPIILVAVIIVTTFCYAYPIVLAKRRNKKWAQKLATLKNEDRATAAQISMAKRNSVEIAIHIAREARQMLGGMGITGEYPIMRHMMNLESVITYEGTHDIHLLITGMDITGEDAFK